MAKLPPEKMDKGAELRRQGLSYRETADILGCAASTVGYYWPDSWVNGGGDDAKQEVMPEPSVAETGDQRTMVLASKTRIRTLEDAVAYAEVDLSE